MAATRKTLSNYAQLMRISNLPTCLANVLTGTAIGMQFGQATFAKVAALTIAVCCYYCGGMILNDLCDLKYDSKYRQNRPIASGAISVGFALAITIVLFFSATFIVTAIAQHALLYACALLACIILYDILHKKFPVSIVFMGGCRAMVYITVAVAVAEPSESAAAIKMCLPFAIILALYTIGITVIARMENQERLDWRKWLSIAIPLSVFGILFFVRPSVPFNTVLACIIFVFWMYLACLHIFTKPPRIKYAVLAWLSGMCLVDMWFLSVLLDNPTFATIAFVCFIITIEGHKQISGT